MEEVTSLTAGCEERKGMPTDRAFVARRHQPRTAVRPGRRRVSGDDGFSVIEVMVAIAVIGIVMTAMAPFLARSMVVAAQQRTEQVAVEIANDALERARALKPTSLLAGRGEETTKDQWEAAGEVDKVAAYLATMQQDWDPADPDAGAQAPLPTIPQEVTVGGKTYEQHWYVGRCWQPKADPRQIAPVLADCVAPAAAAVPAATDISFFRIVVAVTWSAAVSSSDGSCKEGICVYVASTLVNTGSDPTFDLKRPPPTVTPPSNQSGYVGDAVNLQLAASGGWLPRTWSAPVLPPGLSLSASSGLISGSLTTAGSYSVTVTVTDREGKTDDATFTWTVAEPPALTTPGDQTSRTGTAVSLPIPVTGGLEPMSWSATGLPAELSINAATGVISGTPTTEQTAMQPVKVTVVAGKYSASVEFGWRVLTPVRLDNLAEQTVPSGLNVGTFSMPVHGGLGPYTWTATGIPDGLSLDAAGQLTGTFTNGTRYVATVTVTDSAGGTATLTVVWNVTTPANRPRVTSPTTDHNSTVGAPVGLNATADGGAHGYTWTASGLPPGVTFSSSGVFGGSPTQAGRHIVRLTVTDRHGARAHLMYVWTVTS
jgi:prepilin-type N-terminal cleavage/methylation domain-containing protein